MVSFVMDIRSTRSAEDMTYNILDLDGQEVRQLE